MSLKWYEICLLAAANTAIFTITDAKLYVPIVTLSIEDNSKLTKLLNEGFKRPIYWNEYKVNPNKVVEIAAVNDVKYIRELLDSSCQGVKKDYLFVPIIILLVIIKFLLIHIKSTLFQELKQIITTLKLMQETFMINQLMIQINNMMRLEKNQQDKVIIAQLVVYYILLILKTIID